MARQLGLRAELTCIWQVLRFDHRVLNSERSGPVHKPPSLELSLLERRDYLHALGGLRKWRVLRDARSVSEMISHDTPSRAYTWPFINNWKGLMLALLTIVLLNVQKSSTFLIV